MQDLKQTKFFKVAEYGKNFLVEPFDLDIKQCEKFVDNIIILMNENENEKTPLYNKSVFRDPIKFIEKLAGRVLFSTTVKDVYKFGSSFFDEKTQDDTNSTDPVHLEILKIKNAFEIKLKEKNKTFKDLKQFKMRIRHYFTCPEEVLPYDSLTDEQNDINDVEDFLKHLYFLKTPNDIDFVKVLDKKIGFNILTQRYFSVDFSRAFMSEFILNWMAEQNERPLDRKSANAAIDDMKQKLTVLEFAGTNSRYCIMLEDYKVSFAANVEESNKIQEELKKFFNKSNKNQVLFFRTDYYLFGALRMLQILKGREIDNYVFDNAAYLSLQFENLKTVFHTKKAVNLIIVVCEKGEQFDVGNLLKDVAPNKKVIIITENEKNDHNHDKSQVIVDNTNIKHFDDPVNTIMNKKVTFQGNTEIILNDLLENNADIVDNDTLITLIKNEDRLVIGKAPREFLGYVKDFFIERSFNREIVFDSDILKEASSMNCFLVESETYPLPEKNEYVKILSSLANYQDNFGYANVHFFKKKGEKLIWQKSSNCVEFLLKQKRKSTETSVDIIFNVPLLIISNVAGMGKSTILTPLILEYKKRFPAKWVIRINILTYRRLFNNLKSAEILQVILNKELPSSFDKHLFNNNCIQNKTLIIFDSVEEICLQHRKKVYELIDNFKILKANIWITTRTYLQPDFEHKYETISVFIEPFHHLQQIKFLMKYWNMNYKKELSETKRRRMEKFAEAIIEKFCEDIDDNNNSFGAIPQQLKLLAEFFQDESVTKKEWDTCFNYIEKESDEDPHLPITLDLYALYKMFVEKKIMEIYLNERCDLYMPHIAQEYMDNNIEHHEILALKRLLDDESLKFVLTDDQYNKVDTLMNDKNIGTVGVIATVENGEINFIHLTFAEYFVATAVSKKLLSCGTSSKEIFEIINKLIPTMSSVFVVCISKIFTSDFEKSKKGESCKSQKLLNGKSLVTYALTENFISLFKSLVENGFESSFPNDAENKTPLHYVAKNGDLELLEFLLEYHNDLMEKSILKHGRFIKPEYKSSKLVTYVDEKDIYKKTALFYAKSSCNSREQSKKFMKTICQLLLSGADTTCLEGFLKEVALYVLDEVRDERYDHKYTPLVELLLLQAPDAVKDFDVEYEFQWLFFFLFYYGRLKVICKIINSLDEKLLWFDIKKFKLLTMADTLSTLLDTVNYSEDLTDLERLKISEYLLKNYGTTIKRRVLLCCSTCDYCPITNILQAAARDGHLKTLEKFLVLEPPQKWYLHLATACEYKRYNIIRFLLQTNNNIYHCGNSPLHTAVDRNLDRKFINEEFLNRYDINERNENGETPLFMALKARSDLSQIKNLVQHGAKVNISTDEVRKSPEIDFLFPEKDYGNVAKTPLELAIENELYAVVKYFLTKCSDDLTDLSRDSTKVMLRYYQNPEYDLNEYHNSLLKEAINRKDEALCKFIIKRGKNINVGIAKDQLHTDLSRNRGLINIMELLMQYGAIYEEMIYYKHNDSVIFLKTTMSQIFADVKILENKEILFRIEDSLVYLMNAKNLHLQTMLHAAVQQKNLKVTNFLLGKNKEFLNDKRHGSIKKRDYLCKSINEKDGKNRTPLQIAVENGSYDIVLTLLVNGAYFDETNNAAESCPNDTIKQTLSHIQNAFKLVSEGNISELKQKLPRNSLPIKCIDKDGKNLLHHAVLISDQNIAIKIVLYLLKMEIDTDIIDNDGKTILFYVIERNNLNLLKLLLQNMIFTSVTEFDKTNGNACKEMINTIYYLFYIMEYYDETIFHWSDAAPFDLNILCNSFKGNFTLLHFAVETSYLKAVQWFLKNGATVNKMVEDLANEDNIKSLFNLISLLFNNVRNIKRKFAQKLTEKITKNEITYEIITNVRRLETPFLNKPARAVTLLHKAAWLGELK